MQRSYVLEQLLQLFVLVALDENVLVVNVFDDEVMLMLGVNLDQDSLDGGIALYQDAYLVSAGD